MPSRLKSYDIWRQELFSPPLIYSTKLLCVMLLLYSCSDDFQFIKIQVCLVRHLISYVFIAIKLNKAELRDDPESYLTIV